MTEPYAYRDDPTVPDFDDDQPLIVFDGDCVLCSRSMRMILRLDRHKRFRLTPAQSDLGQKLYGHVGLPSDRFETYLLIANGSIHQRTAALIEISKHLGWPWKAGAILVIVPRPIRDALYNFVARHRYRLFGRKIACGIADPALRQRML